TGMFDFEKAHEHPMWAKELYGFPDHVPETEEYGVTSHVYRARQPFDPEAIHAVLNGNMPGVIRAKGHFWLATRPDWVAEFSLAGALSSVAPIGVWWASVPIEQWPPSESAKAYLKRAWTEPWGDRRQELVFIGAGIDWQELQARLDACLIAADKASSQGDLADLSSLPDPFPRWARPGTSQAA
ncbi:MAG: GTP-binding protein, partial [Pseudomonadota bacterium]